MIYIGCCGHTDTYQTILQMGYDYVELSARQIMQLSDEEFKEFLKIYDQNKLPCRGFNDYCSEKYPIVGPQSGSIACQEYARKVCERGNSLGIQSIGIGAPSARILPKGYGTDQANSDMVRFLQYICPIASEYGITILLEAVHKYLCNYLNSTDEVLDIVKALDIPNLAIVLDYYHAKVMGEDLNSLSYVMPYVRHLHISTDLDGHYRGFMREQDVDMMRELLRAAAMDGYDGGISVEAVPDRLKRDGGACSKWMRMALPDA